MHSYWYIALRDDPSPFDRVWQIALKMVTLRLQFIEFKIRRGVM